MTQMDDTRKTMSDNLKTHAGTVPDREGVRHALFEGRDHLVVPVVMVVAGILKGSDGPVLFPPDEVAKHPAAWNGRPVPVLHPERHGRHISANNPDVIESNSIGHVFNAYAENGKLKAELWIDVDKAMRLGHGELIRVLEAGEIVEISTGYFSDFEPRRGEYNGEVYIGIQRNIRPDHLALLPGEIGACSVADGCGTRVNSSMGGLAMKVGEAIETISKALGLRVNCDGGTSMNKLEEHLKANEVDEKTVEKITANKKISPEQVEFLMGMDGQQLKQALALADSLLMVEDEPEPEGQEGDVESMACGEDEKMTTMSRGTSKAPTEERINELVANKVDEAIRRREVVAKLTTNEKCPFTEDEMKDLSVNHLEKLEKSIRPADYSGQGGFATNAGFTDNVQPLVPRGGVVTNRKQKEAN